MKIYYGSKMSDDERRQELYKGSVFVYAPSTASLKLCQFARDLTEEAFHHLDPRTAHETLPVEKCVEILAALKPRFIHDPKSKECIQGMLAGLGCDPEKTYFDVPRMRTTFPGDYLKSGIAYAFHPHRDTWYSAPMCQINFWMPMYPLSADNCMALHPHYFNHPVKNGSRTYNYDEWNMESRQNASKHIKTDTRVQPKPEEPVELDPQVRLVCEVGSVFIFSAAQLHSTVPNTAERARYSIDFRTVHLDDVWARTGAHNIDSECTGTTMRDYLRGADLAHLPEEAVSIYNDGTVVEAK
jgi:hypothetical protein